MPIIIKGNNLPSSIQETQKYPLLELQKPKKHNGNLCVSFQPNVIFLSMWKSALKLLGKSLLVQVRNRYIFHNYVCACTDQEITKHITIEQSEEAQEWNSDFEAASTYCPSVIPHSQNLRCSQSLEKVHISVQNLEPGQVCLRNKKLSLVAMLSIFRYQIQITK